MKLGLMYANSVSLRPEDALAVAGCCERAGFDSLWTVDHVVVPGGHASTYPYSRSGRLPGGEDAPIPDPLVWLAYVAARTARILLATGMLVLPQRSPLVVAKQVATLDQLSGGRVVLGVGLGWLREEFAALGVPWERRGERTEEYVAAMRTLWREDRPTHHGRTVSFDDARLWPKPARRQVPIVLGGHTERAAERAGRIADGYFPGRTSPEHLAPLLAALRRGAERAGRDPAGIEVSVAARPTAESAERLAELGVARMLVLPRAPGTEAVCDLVTGAAEALRGAGALR